MAFAPRDTPPLLSTPFSRGAWEGTLMARAKDKVVVGWVHPHDVGAGFCDSMLALHVYDLTHEPHRLSGRIGRYSSANISNARNWVVKTFLKGSTADWLLFIDTDMTFPETLVEDLLTNASRDRAPIVGALCFGIDDDVMFPTLYGVAEGWEGEAGVHTIRYDEFPPDAMFQVAATGAACLLIHRSVLERVRDLEHEKGNYAFEWFQETTFNGNPCGEDTTFCFRAGAAGFPVYVDTGVSVGHMKPMMLTRDRYAAQRKVHQDPPVADSSQSATGVDPDEEA